MSENQAETSRPRRRWLQYSLRSLLMLTVVVASGASWLAVRIEEAREQKQAVDEIKKLDVTLDYGHGGWLSSILGDDFIPVIGVRFVTSVDGDTALRHLTRLKRLKRIQACLGGGDSGFTHLEGMTQLEEVSLICWSVTDNDLRHLKRLTRLKRLHLGRNLATTKGVEELKKSLPGAEIRVWTREDVVDERTWTGDDWMLRF